MKYISDEILQIAVRKCVKLLKGEGMIEDAIIVEKIRHSKFPNSTEVLNELGALYRKKRDFVTAKNFFRNCLKLDPKNGYALVNLGQLLYREAIVYSKTIYKRRYVSSILSLNHSLNIMEEAFKSKFFDDMDVRFFYYYGYALIRIGRENDAVDVFEAASHLKHFPSFWQRSGGYLGGIKSKPFWTIQETKIGALLKTIKARWLDIRNEARYALRLGLFKTEIENLHDEGKWSEFFLYLNGKRYSKHCMITPVTCMLVDHIPHISGNLRGAVKFSVMESGTHVCSHSGQRNCNLRIHLGLDTKQCNMENAAGCPSKIRVVNEYATWKNGQFVVFDDSFDHEVWHYSYRNESRLVLIMDMWHPNLSISQISYI